jgi:hypothetical protein
VMDMQGIATNLIGAQMRDLALRIEGGVIPCTG